MCFHKFSVKIFSQKKRGILKINNNFVVHILSCEVFFSKRDLKLCHSFYLLFRKLWEFYWKLTCFGRFENAFIEAKNAVENELHYRILRLLTIFKFSRIFHHAKIIQLDRSDAITCDFFIDNIIFPRTYQWFFRKFYKNRIIMT